MKRDLRECQDGSGKLAWWRRYRWPETRKLGWPCTVRMSECIVLSDVRYSRKSDRIIHDDGLPENSTWSWIKPGKKLTEQTPFREKVDQSNLTQDFML